MKARGIDGPDKVIACCGGGGLSAGLALACPDAQIIAVEPEGWDDLTRSLAAGEILSVEDLSYPTECDALQTPATWPINFRSEEHPSELQSLMRISYAVFCLKKKKITIATLKRPQLS